jgi:hypothetical protein
MNSINESARDKIIFADFLVDIFKYLPLKDLYIIKSSSKIFQNLIDEEESIIFDKINFSYEEQNYHPFYKNFFLIWLFKILQKNKVKSINLLFCYNHYLSKEIINTVNNFSLEKLKVHVKIFKTGNDITHLRNLKSLSVKNMFYDQSDFQDNIRAITNIIKMSWIEQLKFNNIKFVNCFFLELVKNKFSKIDFKESAEFTIQEMTDGINNFSKCLKILRIDGEFSQETVMIKNLSKLENLTELYVGYCQNFSDYFITEITKLNLKLTKLSLRKLRVSSAAIENFFESGEFSKIVKFDFYDCPTMNNKCVKYIADKALNLEYLEISWSYCVRDDSIQSLLKNCVKLRYVYLQGCKHLTDNIFNKFLSDENENCSYYNRREVSIFPQLRMIDLSKCDLIQDKTLYRMIEKFACLYLINYYGVDLKDEMTV